MKWVYLQVYAFDFIFAYFRMGIGIDIESKFKVSKIHINSDTGILACDQLKHRQDACATIFLKIFRIK